MLSTLVLNRTFLNPCLDYENSNDETTEKPEDEGEIYYEEPDQLGGIEGIDYGIVYGAEDEDTEAKA